MARVLLVLSEEEVRGEVARLLERQGHEVLQSPGAPDCYDRLRDARPQVLVAEEAPDLLAEALRVAPTLPIVVCLKTREASRALEHLKRGAFECIAPPWTGEALGAPVRRAARVQGTRVGFSWRDEPKPRKRAAIAVAAAVAIAGGLGVSKLFEKPDPSKELVSRPLPYHHPAGAAWHGGLWVSDWFSQSVYRHAGDFSIEKLYHLPDATPGAIAFAEGSMYVATSTDKWLKVVPGDSLVVASRFDAAGPKTVGLCYDGLYLWSVDGEEKRMRKHLVDDRLSVVDLYEYPIGGLPAAIACDEKHFWSIDEQTGELVKHDPRRPDLVLERSPLNEYKGGVWRATGLVFDGTFFWSVAERRDGTDGRAFRHRNPWAG